MIDLRHSPIGFRLRTAVLTPALLLPFLIGCGAEKAEFKLREETTELYKSAQKFVAEDLEYRFGTPQELVAWRALPVDFGGVFGSVAAFEGDPDDYDTDHQFRIEIDIPDVVVDSPTEDEPTAADTEVEGPDAAIANPLALTDGTVILFTTGNYQGARMKVREYDAEQGILTVQGTLSELPEPGSEFVAHPGHTLRAGRALYHEHCMHCHGVSGDGNGPTAPYLNPLPRDYRLGIFKFKGTAGTDRIQREDIARVLKHGVPGTYMPSFMLLTDDELHALVEYVRWLSFRGQYENIAVSEIAGLGFDEAGIEAKKEAGLSRGEIEAEWQTALKDEVIPLIDEGMAFRIEDWNRSQNEDSVLRPMSPATATTTDLVDWISTNREELTTGSVTSVEKEDDETAVKIDYRRVKSGDILFWTSGAGKGKTLKVPSARRGKITLEAGDAPGYEIAEGDSFLILKDESIGQTLNYVLNDDLTMDKLIEAANNPEELETTLEQASADRGRALFVSKEVNCHSCHGPKGLGNGPQTREFMDIPGKPGEKFEQPGLHDTWGNPIMPRNLATGIYRGGRRPVDLYRRIHSGIAGSGMPAHSTSLIKDGHDLRIWDVINYVYAVPYRADADDYLTTNTDVPAPELDLPEPETAPSDDEEATGDDTASEAAE